MKKGRFLTNKDLLMSHFLRAASNFLKSERECEQTEPHLGQKALWKKGWPVQENIINMPPDFLKGGAIRRFGEIRLITLKLEGNLPFMGEHILCCQCD